jgi:ubiquinone/menaquinone biosynthesis C-methylase UbiE
MQLRVLEISSCPNLLDEVEPSSRPVHEGRLLQPGTGMLFGSYGADYRRAVLWQRLLKKDRAKAYEAAVGGAFADAGRQQVELLRSYGLEDAAMVVDVGCGAGRLAAQLSLLPGLSYVGLDVVPELLDSARQVANRPDWRFEIVERTHIPASDAEADFCVFFSVFTHLPEPVCLDYLAEARRVLKPGGKAVFSFLDPNLARHARPLRRNLFRLIATRTVYARNVGCTPDRLREWARQLSFEVLAIESPHPGFGQSIAAFTKPG